MIRSIEALNFRCLRHVQRDLGSFHVLVGPNASGKTTFLDVVSFLGRLVSDGLEAAVSERTQNFQDLVWGRSGAEFELAIEAEIPANIPEQLIESGFDRIRYEVALGTDPPTGEIVIRAEKALLEKKSLNDVEISTNGQHGLFPNPSEPPQTILTPRGKKGTRQIISKAPGGNDNFYSEVGQGGICLRSRVFSPAATL